MGAPIHWYEFCREKFALANNTVSLDAEVYDRTRLISYQDNILVNSVLYVWSCMKSVLTACQGKSNLFVYVGLLTWLVEIVHC